MKKIESEGMPRPTERVTGMGKFKMLAVTAAGALLLAGSVTAGYYTAPEDTRTPVVLAGGEIIKEPCYVAVEGECVAVVEDKAAAKEVVDRVKDEYKNASTKTVEIEEETSIENMELENGAEKPEIMTAAQASEEIVEKEALTVKTTEVIEIEETVEYKTIEKESAELQLGEVLVQQEGEQGKELVKKEVTKENGEIVDEKIISQKIVKQSVPEITVYGNSGLADPLDNIRLTSSFGERWGRQHSGLDLGMEEGAAIYAVKSGTVTCASFCDSYGNLVKIDHGDGMETYYAHCSRLDVVVGQQVETGQQIAAVGSTGNSTGPHLHFEVRIDGIAEDPAEWLQLGTD